MAAADKTTKTGASAKAPGKPVLTTLSELLTDGRHDEVIEIVKKLVARNGELERRLADLLSRGRRSEGVSTAQLGLLLQSLEEAETSKALGQANDELKAAADLDALSKAGDKPAATAEKPKRQPPVRRALPPNLRRVPNPIAVPADERACPCCGEERKSIGYDTTNVVELIPAEIIVRVDQREKLSCKACDGELVRAPRGDKLIEGGILGPRLVGGILVDKYWDGLPLNRTKQRLERLGLSVPISTLADQVTWAADLLRPLQAIAMERVLAATIMHIDATSLPVLDRDSEHGLRLGSLWGCVGDKDIALYLYCSTGKSTGQKEGEIGPADLLARRKGFVVADAGTVFDSSFQGRTDLIECGCNMHGRRYFKRALERNDGRAALPIGAFKRLYEIEEEIRDLNPEEKSNERRRRSRPIYEQLMKWCDAHRKEEPPSSKLGEALRYMNNQREALMRFLDDGRIPIDNGIVERLHVRTAMTRKAYLFAGSDAGGDRAAVMYTILGCCQLAGVNPVEYFGDVLPRLARGGLSGEALAELMPDQWKAARVEAETTDAVA